MTPGSTHFTSADSSLVRSAPPIGLARRQIANSCRWFDPKIWRPAVMAAGIVPSRSTGMHALRHFYASRCSTPGRASRPSPPTSATLTPDSPSGCTHLMPASEERTRNAIDRLFRPQVVDGPEAA